MKKMELKKIKIYINDKEFEAFENETVLEVATRNGIKIPALCKDKNLDPITSCFLCIGEIENAKGLQPLCSVKVAENLKVKLNTDEIYNTRKMNLELLLSNHFADCYAPCRLACPANVDVQGYIALAKKGQLDAAIQLIKESIPLPVVIGRVCPKPCEENCRRKYVDEAVAIDDIKRFIAEKDLFSSNPFIPQIEKDSGKKVAVIGSGPAGLSAAYYLKLKGHSVDIYEKMDKPGGMLRYGIPSYRLDRDVLDKEINHILSLGINIYYNKELGRDFSLNDLFAKGYDAIFVGIGAQKGSSLGIKGSELQNVFSAVEFLRDVENKKYTQLNGIVFVIGGGNTAIDAARTSLRLGAEKVIIAYRRTEKEMPANLEEIIEAKEEGIEIRELINPVEYIGNNNVLRKVKFIKMKLGEPDSSGRRRPIPIENSEFEVYADYVIEAIGQKIDDRGLENIDKQRKGWIVVNEKTYETSIKGVFAGGDCVIGPDLVVTALAHGRKAAFAIDQYLRTGKSISENRLKFFIRKEDFRDLSEEDFKGYEKIERNKPYILEAEKRKFNFKSYNYGLSEEQFKREIERCLECGCQDVNECKLKEYSFEYKVDKNRFKGEYRNIDPDKTHPYILKENNKCINCGRCIEICGEYTGLYIFGFYKRGFQTEVTTAWDKPLGNTLCVSCGNCIDACPVGALTEKQKVFPMGPFKNERLETVCIGCGKGCEIVLETYKNIPVKVQSEKILCNVGKFGWEEYFIENSIYNDLVSISNAQDKANKLYEEIKNQNNLILLNPYFSIDFYENIKNKFKNSKLINIEALEDLLKLKILVNNGFIINFKYDINDIYSYNSIVILEKQIDKKYGSLYYELFRKGGNFFVDLSLIEKRIFKNSRFYPLETLNDSDIQPEVILVNLSNFNKEELYNIFNKLDKKVPVLPLFNYPNASYLISEILSNKYQFSKYENLIIIGYSFENYEFKFNYNFKNIYVFDYKNSVFPLDDPLNSKGYFIFDGLKLINRSGYGKGFVNYNFMNFEQIKNIEKILENIVKNLNKIETFSESDNELNNFSQTIISNHSYLLKVFNR